jgi:hypothetical protein
MRAGWIWRRLLDLTQSHDRRDLALGTATANAHEYCGNAEIFDASLAGA